jgi:hypothetical protein
MAWPPGLTADQLYFNIEQMGNTSAASIPLAWTSGYKTTQLLGGENRFVLSTSGHIAGIVNTPNPKAKHWVNDSLPADSFEWKETRSW